MAILTRRCRRNACALTSRLVHAPSLPGQPITEDSPLDPNGDSPRSKVETEELIRAEHGVAPVRQTAPAMVWGVTAPWTLFASAALGVVAMTFPAVLEISGTDAHTDYMVEALVTTVAAVAMAEVARAIRFLNVLFGAWLAVAPWLSEGAGTGARLAGLALGSPSRC